MNWIENWSLRSDTMSKLEGDIEITAAQMRDMEQGREDSGKSDELHHF